MVVTAAEDPVAAGFGRARTTDPERLSRCATNKAPSITPGPDAYLIYTSGTTRIPKGVRISQAGLDAFLAGMGEVLDIPDSARAMIVSPFHLDGSFATLFGAVRAGDLVTIPSRDWVTFPRNFARWVERYSIDTTGFSPTYLRLVLRDRGVAKAQSSLSSGTAAL